KFIFWAAMVYATLYGNYE
nr:Chain N, Unknown fragment [Chlamydomonas reinhardtii]